ncbi:MAG: putative fluoride ion transporter CrcB [Planctomycetaceae bacterium]|nr:MAG: putative fluoride ion transporter CrcB [Planctomycetaceae bacterium]
MLAWYWQVSAVALGGAAGAVSRHFLNIISMRVLGTAFPYGTMLINLTGSFVLGWFLTTLPRGTPQGEWWRLLIAVGFLGAYTTFSTWTYESHLLFREGLLGHALGNLLGSLLCGMLAVWLGVWAGSQ